MDIIGQKFGYLTVLSRNGSKGKSSAWLCQCDCGNTCTILRHHLTDKHGTKSCGCLKIKLMRGEFTTCKICQLKLKTTEDFYLKGKGIRCNICKSCLKSINNTKKKERNNKLRMIVLEHYSGGTPQCACCSEKITDFLCVDHINNDGNKHRKLLNEGSGVIYKYLIDNQFPPGFQILCNNCNWGKHKNNGVCPHKLLS